MSFETVASTVVVLAILVGLIAFLAFLKKRGESFTFRVFTALGLGVVFGAGIQIVLGLGTDATKTALDWMSIVGQGYINLLKMLVMPLVFVAIVGAFTRAEVTDNLGKIGAVVLVVLLATVAIAAIVGWAVIAFSGLAGASFADGTVGPDQARNSSGQTGNRCRAHHSAGASQLHSDERIRRFHRKPLYVHHRGRHFLGNRGRCIFEVAR